MTRKTVMHRETEVFVVEEKLAPRKEAIKRRVKLERCIAAGINLGAMILTGGALVKIGLMVFAVIDSRTGGLGGEVLVFPALAMMFLWGREIGLGEARREAEAIVERVKYTGSTANPAIVTQQVLAQVLGFEQVKVLESTYNVAKPGEEANMQFICDSNAALMCYATNTPQVDEPSAGYIFTWDMLGNGSYTAMDQYEGENGTHSEFIEGLISTDMKKTADDLATYFTDCV